MYEGEFISYVAQSFPMHETATKLFGGQSNSFCEEGIAPQKNKI